MARKSSATPSEILDGLKIIVSAKTPEQKEFLRAISQNTITFVTGPAGTGKCITLDSMVSTKSGLVYLDDIMHDECNSYRKTNETVVNRYGQYEAASHLYNSGERDTKKVTTQSGYSIEGTLNHRILCLSESGIEWQYLEDVHPGSVVCINRIYPTRDGSDDNDLGYFLGLMIGSGSYTLKNSFNFSNKDPDLILFFQDFCDKRLGNQPVRSKSRPCDWILNSQKARKQLSDWGLDHNKGDLKQIPTQWLCKSTEFVCNLLQGLFDTNGRIDESGTVGFLSKSEVLSRQVHILLLSVGIVSTLAPKLVKYKGEYTRFYQTNILHSALDIFARKIGFRVSDKSERLNLVLDKTRNTNKDVIPDFFAKHLLGDYYSSFSPKDRIKQKPFRFYSDGSRSLSYPKLRQLYEQFRDKYSSADIEKILDQNYYFDTIVNVDHFHKTVGDFVIPGSHSFIANGFVNHNTFLTVAYGLQQLFKEKFEKIVLTRPVIEAAGEKLGFLPGDMIDKINPYLMPIFDAMSQVVPIESMNKLMLKNSNGHSHKDSAIRIIPLAYMRGVAQPMYSKILTTYGWTTMGNISSGSYVIGSDGQPTKVTNVYHHKRKKIYRMSFSDGSFTDCCDEHLWLTQTLSEKRHTKPFSVKTTKQIMKTLKTRFGQKNHEIPVVSNPVKFESRDVAVDPYLLGLLLGNGNLHETATIKFTTKDTEIIDYIHNKLKDIGISTTYASQYDYRLSKESTSNQRSNPLKDAMRQLNLLGSTSHTKFIPDCYKYNDVHIRIEVLRGLMDTDGHITRCRTENRRINFYSASERLANDVIEIVQSLGGVAHKRLKKTSTLVNEQSKWINTENMSHIWVVDIVYDGANLFRLKRKADVYATSISPRVKRLISDVSYIGEMECQCIEVEHENRLYLTDNCIVTHNTFRNSFIICDEMQNSTPDQIRMLLTRLGEGSKMIISGDTRQTDISGTNGLSDSMELLKDIDGIEIVELTEASIVRHHLVQKIEERYEARHKERELRRKTHDQATNS